ncbi:hypothetical protein L6164_012413 [Bauhinia variegata]|uniref:Uncharacterized protein n=1 Tax=Bauhinia variegata TaxID=167791 RepID=A0ACB9PA95_BAUVA|nr:hypothetical protein L6164_012413 [Bauhinia variegata]
MKRSLGSSDSLGGLITICPSTDEHSPRNNDVYGREFQSMLHGLDEEGRVEESGHVSEKKRRLSVEQVKALEKNFEVENKLEPERKVRLAQELGLQPRQVAVWFQNRRARWKTKQLERDYGVLKANYEALKLNFESLQNDNEALRKEIMELKSRLQEDNTESEVSVKEEINLLPDSDDKMIETSIPGSESKELKYDCFNSSSNRVGSAAAKLFPVDLKDGASDSDSSAILNEDNNSPNGAISSSGVLQNHQLLMSPPGSSSSPSSTVNCFQFQRTYLPQYVKTEEHNFFGADDDEACNFFSDEQAPTLQWYCSDQWS